MESSPFYTVKEFASLLRVHPSTIRRAIIYGRIQAFKVGTGERATYRIFKTELGRMAEFDASQMIDKVAEERAKVIGLRIGAK